MDGQTSTNDTGGHKQDVSVHNQEVAHMDAMMATTQQQSKYRCAVMGGCGCCDNITRKLNLWIEETFAQIGNMIGKYPWIAIAVVLFILVLCCIGLGNAEMEDNIFNLWTPTDSPIWEEDKFIDKYWTDEAPGTMIITAEGKNGKSLLDADIVREWYDLHLRMKANLPKAYFDYNGSQVEFGLFYEGYYDVDDLTTLGTYGALGMTVPHYTSRVVPFCRPGAFSPLEAQFELPCQMLTILDCFTEGGSFFPYENYLKNTFFVNLLYLNPYTYRPSFEDMTPQELGQTFGPSCPIFSGKILPYNYLFGGETRVDPDDDTSEITHLKTFESIFLLDSPFQLARKIKIATGQCTYSVTYGIDCDEITDKETEAAEKFQYDWLGDVIDYLLDEVDSSDNIVITFWTPRTGHDLLQAASKADFGLILIAYVSMIVFAALTALKPNNLFLSKSEASFFGVILVLLSVAGTIGVGCSFVKLSPNIVQVLPFIALGFGVDDMFVLLFAFRYRESLTVQQMIGETVRVAGSSVALTSIANTLAFAIATAMVLPDIQRFATFGVIVVLLNFISVIFGFTAILSLVARRMKKGYKDWSFCCCFMDFTKARPDLIRESNEKNKLDAANQPSIFDRFFDVLILTPVRIVCVIIFFVLIIVGCIGIGQIRTGLPLADIVPSGTYAAEWLDVRTRFYHTFGNSIYTDADGAKQKSIDWPNLFETWIEDINDVHSISPLVYDGLAVHSFWALDLQEYLVSEHDVAHFNGSYYMGEPFSLSTDVEYTSKDCETDRVYYCNSVFFYYTFYSPLWLCMYANYNQLSSESCQSYLDSLIPDAVYAAYTYAHQLYVYNIDETYPDSDYSVSGLYVKADADTTNVYWKYPDYNGFIYQTDCGSTLCPWNLLSSDFELLFVGDATDTDPDTTPSQNGWNNAETGDPAAVAHNYLDFVTVYLGLNRRNDSYIYADSTQPTTFSYTGNGRYEWELMQKMIGETTTFETVSMGTVSNQVECDAVLEASEICVGIKEEDDFGYVDCGDIETSALETHWYVNSCSSENDALPYVVVATDASVSEITADEACNCNGDSSFYYLTDVVNTTASDASDADCYSPTQTVSITCNSFSDCDSLTACYEEFEEFAELSGHPGCNVSDLLDYESDYLTMGVANASAESIASCLLSYHDELSDCCQTAIFDLLLSNDQFYSCAALNTYTADVSYSEATPSKQTICQSKDKCSFNSTGDYCYNNCYGNAWADCAGMVAGFGCTDYSCLSTYAAYDHSGCCSSSLAAEVSAGTKNCVIPVSGFWDYDTFSYDYSYCNDNTSVPTLNNGSADCGNAYNASSAQLNCLIANVDGIDEGCCKNAVTQISSNTYAYTAECQHDTMYYCNGTDAASADDACLVTIGTQAALNLLSPKCLYALGLCASFGDWPLTVGGTTAIIACDDGWIGNQTLFCDATSGLASWSDDINKTDCVIQTCEEGADAYDQIWPETQIGHIAVIQGGYTSGDDQISDALKAIVDGGSACDLIGTGSTYYARRYCKLSGGVATWQDPLIECRPMMYSWTVSHEATVCDFMVGLDANMIAVIPWTLVFPEYPQSYHFSISEQYCEAALDNCAGYTYQNISGNYYSYFFDYCPLLSMDGVTDDYLTFTAPMTVPQATAAYCSATTFYDPDVDFVPAAQAWSEDGFPDPACFYNLMWMYYTDPSGGALFQDAIEFTIPYADINVSNTVLLTSSNSLAIKGMTSEELGVEFILDIRKRMDQWSKQGIYTIPAGFIIAFYSQYIGVEAYLVTNLIFVSIAVIGVGFVFLLNPIAVLICVVCNTAMILEVYGFSHWVGLRVNGVLVLNIVVAIGLTMEFTAHIGRAFVLSTHSGSISLTEGQIRMKKTLKEMFVPISLGAVTTVIGVAPISAAQFPYFKLYYFNLYILIVVFGWLNGVIFQPILLSLYPPKNFEMDDDSAKVATTSQSTIGQTSGAGHEKHASIELGDTTMPIDNL